MLNTNYNTLGITLLVIPIFQGYMIDVRQVLDIIATLQPPTTIADIFNDGEFCLVFTRISMR